MIAFQPIFFTTGLFLITLALFMIAPGMIDYFQNDVTWQAFAISAGVTGFAGLLLTFAARPDEKAKVTVRDAFLITTVNWFVLCLFSALPFVLSCSTLSLTDALFEAVSGLTTTGATVIQNLNYVSSGILLWRSSLQWLGGIGIIVMALTVLPLLRVGGMQLFRSEFSDRSEKILPKVSQIASAILGTYIFFTILCALSLWGAGMTWFEALCHALSTLSTGGFSSHKDSIEHFNNVYIEIVLIIFMIIGSTTLLLFVRFFQGNRRSLYQDQQVHLFLVMIIVTSLGCTLWLWFQYQDWERALRHAFFQVVSLVTTTGFATSDFTKWGSFPLLILLILSTVGGCTGSTAGGIKIFRFQVLYATAWVNIQQLRRPHGIFVPLFNGRQILDSVFMSVFTFFGLFLLSFGLLALGLSLFNFDVFTCLSTAISCLNNVGTVFKSLIDHTGDHTSLPQGAKWLLMAGMLLGRLEYVTIIILLTPRFWRE